MSQPVPSAASIYAIGPHKVEQEEHLFVGRFRGTFSLSHAQALTAHIDSLTAVQGPLYAILDMRLAPGPEIAAREWLGRWSKTAQLRGSAIFGANAMVRAVLTLLNNAMRLLHRKVLPVYFCASETEARLWVTTHRQRSEPAPNQTARSP